MQLQSWCYMFIPSQFLPSHWIVFKHFPHFANVEILSCEIQAQYRLFSFRHMLLCQLEFEVAASQL